MSEPRLLQKTESDIMDRCSILEGDESYECWEALFELKKMKRESEKQCNVSYSADGISDCEPLERIEKLVRQSGGVKSLIEIVGNISKFSNLQKDVKSQEQISGSSLDAPVSDVGSSGRPVFPVPDDLPKSQEELEQEEKSRKEDSPYTRMLKRLSRAAFGINRGLD